MHLPSAESNVPDATFRRGSPHPFKPGGTRRVAWFRGEAPLVLAGAFVKAGDPPDAKPAAVVELTYRQHPAPDA